MLVNAIPMRKQWSSQLYKYPDARWFHTLHWDIFLIIFNIYVPIYLISTLHLCLTILGRSCRISSKRSGFLPKATSLWVRRLTRFFFYIDNIVQILSRIILTYPLFRDSIIRECKRFALVNMFHKESNLILGRMAVAFFHFMITFVLDPEHYCKDYPYNWCQCTKNSQQEHNKEFRMLHPAKGDRLLM